MAKYIIVMFDTTRNMTLYPIVDKIYWDKTQKLYDHDLGLVYYIPLNLHNSFYHTFIILEIRIFMNHNYGISSNSSTLYDGGGGVDWYTVLSIACSSVFLSVVMDVCNGNGDFVTTLRVIEGIINGEGWRWCITSSIYLIALFTLFILCGYWNPTGEIILYY